MKPLQTKDKVILQQRKIPWLKSPIICRQGPGTTQVTPEEADNKLNLTVREALSTKRPDPQEQKAAQEKKKEELRSKPYSVELVSYPKSFFFETVHTPGSVIIKLNVNHPFYDAIMKPLRTARITD